MKAFSNHELSSKKNLLTDLTTQKRTRSSYIHFWNCKLRLSAYFFRKITWVCFPVKKKKVPGGYSRKQVMLSQRCSFFQLNLQLCYSYLFFFKTFPDLEFAFFKFHNFSSFFQNVQTLIGCFFFG